MASVVSRIPAASSELALAHFGQLLQFETDCWDVHFAMTNNRQDFVLLDVRGHGPFASGHIEQAINLPRKNINTETLRP